MENGEAAARVATPHDGKRTPSPEEPGVAAPLGDVLPSARFDGNVLDPRISDSEAGDEDEDFADEDDELYDTDNSDSDIAFEDDDDPLEFGDDNDPLDVGDGEAAGSTSTDMTKAPVEFLGTVARFASVGSTAGFMVLGVFPAADQSGHGHNHGGGEITVHYRYAQFKSGGHAGSVEVHGGAKLHPFRFLVPSHAFAADLASSLRMAGAALADMVYPREFSAQLQKLWTNLVAAAPVRAPPWGARVEITVSVGILRRGGRTPERMASMRAALAAEPHVRPFLPNVGVVMHLPAPVRVHEESDEDDVRPAKRRRLVVEDDECAICCEVMERGLAAWPRCSHVFHGECLELLLVRGDQRCPLCRSELNGPG